MPTKGLGPHAESGVENGDDSDVGLVDVSVNTLDKEVLLCEWNGRRWFEKSYVSGLSVLRFSWLFLAFMVVVAGDTPPGEVGEMAPGVCAFDGGLEVPSDSSANEPFLPLAPMR